MSSLINLKSEINRRECELKTMKFKLSQPGGTDVGGIPAEAEHVNMTGARRSRSRRFELLDTMEIIHIPEGIL